MTRTILLFAVATLTSAVAPASAQSAFDGLYAGAYGGYTAISNDNRSVQGGAIAGYRLGPAENLILGLEVQGGLGTLNGEYSMMEGFVQAQAGVEVVNTLLYGSAGIGGRSYDDRNQSGSPFFSAPDSDKFYTLGAGVEFAANDLLHLRFEAQKLINSSGGGYSAGAETIRANFGVLGQFN
jgi:opacity protein-like surface antigen